MFPEGENEISSLQYLQCVFGFIVKNHREKYSFFLFHFVSWIKPGTPEHPFSFQFFHALGLAPRFFSTTYKHAHYLNIHKVKAWFFYSSLNQNSHILTQDLYNSWKIQSDPEKCNQYNPWKHSQLQWELRGCRVYSSVSRTHLTKHHFLKIK